MFDILEGIRIVDLSTVVLGPYATALLADLGANVIKVEAPAGDAFRKAGAAPEGGDGAGFLNLNRNKRSIVLDLAEAEDHATLTALIEQADVLVHNMRPQAAARLRLDWASVRAIRPDIVYCSARGYGEGPLGDAPAYDDIIQSASGLAWLNANAAGEPRFVPTVLCDKVAGLHLALAVASGLVKRQTTGRGIAIETPMYETMVSFLMVEQLGGATFDPPLGPMGYDRLTSPNRRPFRTADGFVTIMPYTTTHWTRFLEFVGRVDLARSTIVTDAAERARNIDMLYSIIAAHSETETSADWVSRLRALDIPCAPVNRIDELLDDPQLAASGMFYSLEHPAAGTLRAVRTPFHVHDASQRPDRPAPMLGADGEAIRTEVSARSNVAETTP